MVMVDENSLSKLLEGEAKLKLIEPQIYSVCQDAEEALLYDKMAKFYDSVVCNRFYNRIAWGYWASSYNSLVQSALTSSKGGWVLDAGCGSLAFTAKTYVEFLERPIIFMDKSLSLLRIAKARLISLKGNIPENMILLQADALQLPFKPQSFKTIVSMNLLHVIREIDKLLLGIKSILEHNGTISFTTLIKSTRFLANRYLNFMGRLGEAVPRDTNQLLAIFEKIGMPVKYNVVGNLAFIRCG